MYDIIPIILIFISVVVIFLITIKKFPALANLDVKNIPAEKEALFKQQIVSNRLKRTIFKWNSKIIRFSRPIIKFINNFFKELYLKLHELKEGYKNQQTITPEDLDKRINQLLIEAEELSRQDDLVMAEKKLIEVIGLDSKNITAFKQLANLYFERKDYEEAKQTFEHILRLEDDNEESLENNGQRGETYYSLALVGEESENMDNALVNIKKALKIEPNNPRYLDTMLRISIIIKDKITALDAYDRLKKVNPENQKLDEIKAQISEL